MRPLSKVLSRSNGGLHMAQCCRAKHVDCRSVSSLIQGHKIAEVAKLANTRILDVSSVDEYNRAHIPGAIRFPVESSLKQPGSLEVVGTEAFAHLLAYLGINQSTSVIVYDSGNMLSAARVWWACRYYGLPDVRVLDGGWAAYCSAGLPVTPVATQPPTDFIEPYEPHGKQELKATLSDILSALPGKKLQILDSRTPAEYSGGDLRNNSKGGHVPTAVNVPHAKFYRGNGDFRLKPSNELSALFASVGLEPAKPTVAYCQAGIRAALATLALTEAGFEKVANYDASMAEWLNRKETPVELA